MAVEGAAIAASDGTTRERAGGARGEARGPDDGTGGLRERVLARGDVATTRARLSGCEAR